MAIVTLIEATPADPATGVAVDVRLAGGGRRGYNHKGFGDWLAGIAGPLRYSGSLGFDQSGWTGVSAPRSAQLRFEARSAARISSIARYFWIGAAVTVSTGDDVVLAPGWTVELTGTVTAIATEGAAMVLTVADRSSKLYVTALPDAFLGTGGLEGGDESAGRPKRRSFGDVFNVEGRLLDGAYNIFEFGDPYRPLSAFVEVRDRGVAGVDPMVIGWQGSAAATLTKLRGAKPPQSGAAIAPSIACVKWWTKPSGPLTADLRGETAGGYANMIGALARQIVTSFEPTITVGAADVSALNTARPGTAGIHCDSSSETVASLLDRLLLPASSLWLFDPDGTLRLRNWTFAGASETLRVLEPPRREAQYPPTLRRALGYKRNHRRQSDSEIQEDDGAIDDVDGTAALAELSIIESDGWLSRDEKPSVITVVAGIRSERAQVVARAQGLGIDAASYSNAYDALFAFLGGLTPAWDDTSQNTQLPNATALQGKFSAYFGARDALQQSIGTTLAKSIARISSDNLIVAGSEKSELVRDVRTIQAQHSQLARTSLDLNAKFGNDPTAAARADADGDSAALDDYLEGLTPAWDDITQDTQIVGGRLRVLFNALVASNAELDRANQAFSTGMIASTLAQLAQIASDGKLTPAEKRVVIQDWAAIVNEAQPLAAQAVLLKKSSVDLTNTRKALGDYLASLMPKWNDLTTTTPIVSSTFNNYFVAYYNAKSFLLTGADKTGDNTANDTLNLGGELTTAVKKRIADVGDTADAANALASSAAQFSDDVADNNKFSKEEKKRYYQTIVTWAGNGAGSVASIVAQLNGYGLSGTAGNLSSTWQVFYQELTHNDYDDLGSSDHIDRDYFRSVEQAFGNALHDASAKLHDYANALSVQTSANLFTDPTFSRLESGKDWTQVTLVNDSGVVAVADGRRMQFNGTTSGINILRGPKVPCSQGDRIDARFDLRVLNDWNAGYIKIRALVTDNNGNAVGTYTVVNVDGGDFGNGGWYTGIPGTFTLPAGSAFVQLSIEANVDNGTALVKNPQGIRVPKALANLDPFGRQQSAKLTSAYAISGNIQARGLNFSATMNSVTISSFQVDFGDGFVSITGTTISGLANATGYYVYLLAPDMTDSGRSFSATTSFTGNTDRQRVLIGFVSTGTGTSTGGGSSSGGAAGPDRCVVETSYLLDELRAADAGAGSQIDLLKPDWSGYERGGVHSLDRGFVPCVRLRTRAGGALECSTTTPIELPDGSCHFAPESLGLQIASLVDGVFRPDDRVVAVEHIGHRWVAHIHVGGRVYAAGVEARARVFTHNMMVKP